MQKVHASSSEHVAWFGACHKVPIDPRCITFSMPGVRLAVRVAGASEVSVRMFGGYGIFRVDLHEGENVRRSVISPKSSGIEKNGLASKLDPKKEHLIIVSKITEPEIRNCWSSFEPCVVESFSIDCGSFLPINAKDTLYPKGYIEVIGDSDACGFGVDGSPTSTSNIFSMDYTTQDVFKAYGTLLSELLGLGESCSTIAASGKGITTNAPFCGDSTLPEMWRKEQESLWMQPDEPPKLIVIMAGGNDFYYNSAPDRERFIETFLDFLREIRRHKGDVVPIYLFQCTAYCCSSEGSPSTHPSEDPEAVRVCETLNELTEYITKVLSVDQIRYFKICTKLEVADHYGIMMHWNSEGQRKIATGIHQLIGSLVSI
jgi:hypothetical protein